MAFLAAAAVPEPLLLVADIGSDSIHLIDVVREAHKGYFARPWSIKKPRTIAVNKASTLVAISTWCIDPGCEKGGIAILQVNGTEGEMVRTIGTGFLVMPRGLCFSADGTVICVMEWAMCHANIFDMSDGGLVRTVRFNTNPYGVVEVEGGWLVSLGRRVKFIGDDPGEDFVLSEVSVGSPRGEYFSSALVTWPGLGFLLRDLFRLQVLATPDTIAMWKNMSCVRVAWMSAVARGILIGLAGCT
jgi:hypothetical protein